jgi:hypothetical protein
MLRMALGPTSALPTAAPAAATPPQAKPPLPGPDDATLLALARARPELAWPADRDISRAYNAHATNTRHDLGAALAADYDWLEGDVSFADGRAVMRHRAGDHVDLDLERWVQVVATSGRGAKFDVKDPAALPDVLDLARRAGIPAHRLIFNVTGLPAPELRAIRGAFPDSIINLSPVSDADLTLADLTELQVAARIVGGRIMFPIRIDLFGTGVLNSLKPLGRVAIWNQPQLWNPRRDEQARLRATGVDGMIDLREPQGVKEIIQSAVVGGAAKVFGWNAVHKALDAVGILDRANAIIRR